MAETPATKARPRRRRWPYVLLALALLTSLGALVLRHYTRPDKLTALLIEQAQSQLGLKLALGDSAGFGLLPRLRVLLPKSSLEAAEGGVLLDADSIGVVVPWHTIWGERVDIERIEIEKPRLDLDALAHWLAARPAGGAAPDVRFAIRVRDGALLASGKPIAEGLNLQFANAGDLAAWLAQVRTANSSLLPPLAGSAEAATLQIGATRIEGLRVEVQDDGAAPKR
ncbi:hypothetical protein [Dokdonella sp.]|uniref:hypothetical protein n=1 Tax=Dokdonella sp. TaxID=2291710 RepID=UPI001B056ED2|nr:hypothetical protein [Dokdonella sp.]MBO9664936.1 hypothetical protein [Dokdonella sp.]